MKVENMQNSEGRAIPNQFIIHGESGKVYFQSYNSLVAELDGDILTIGYDWDYSVTTTKYSVGSLIHFILFFLVS